MSEIDRLRQLYDYHFKTTRRLMDSAEGLSPENYFDAVDPGARSLHDLLFHILGTDRGWRIGLRTGARPEPLDPGEIADLPALRRLTANEERAWVNLLDELDRDSLEAEAELAASPGRVVRIPRWRVLQHVILHGMQHHAEAAEVLTRHGRSPGDLDFIFYSRE